MTARALPRDAATHLRLALLGLGASICERVDGEELPFADEYRSEIRSLTGAQFDLTGFPQWLRKWSAAAPELPLLRLSRAGIDPLELDILLTAGLAGEDPRFAALFGEQGGVALGALIGLWRHARGSDEPQAVRAAVNRLAAHGLLAPANAHASRLDREYSVPDAVWDALSGDPTVPARCRLMPADQLPDLGDFIAAPDVLARTAEIVAALREEPGLGLIVRGPGGNGRSTLAAAIARALGRPLLQVDSALLDQPDEWRQAGIVAFLHDAMISVAPSISPGEVLSLPGFPLEPTRIAAIAEPGSGIRFADRAAASFELPMPGPEERAALWQRALPDTDPVPLADGFRLTSGNLLRAATGARLHARQRGGSAVGRGDIRQALRDLQDRRLDTIASRVDVNDAEFVALDDAAAEELDALALRCCHREPLSHFTGPGPGGLGVRALFAGPSGSGKTLAARRLAYDVGRDLWRIDLAATVNKFIGETEKALDRAFAAAEELDVILLLDEGDALMTRRTDVGNSNDRYANLETNFLLQRIETFSGILIVTTNAADRIDQAFQRRLDVIVPFRAPDEFRRYEILSHLLGDHEASDDLVQEVAVRCALSGGQLRNIALHARLLALEHALPVGDDQLRRAVFREYRKLDAHCPLKPALSAVG